MLLHHVSSINVTKYLRSTIYVTHYTTKTFTMIDTKHSTHYLTKKCTQNATMFKTILPYV